MAEQVKSAAVVKAENPLDVIGQAMGIVGNTIAAVSTAVSDAHIPTAVTHLVNMAAGALKHVPQDVSNPSSWYTAGMEDVGTPFVEAFMRGGLGVNPDAAPTAGFTLGGRVPTWHTDGSTVLRSDSQPGIKELKRLIGFCIAMPFAWAGIEALLKFALGQRVGNALSDTVGKIPSEMGISWAMGMAMSSLFQTAAGRQLEELVNVQLHPNRLDMMTLRTLARQHKISQEQFWGGLDLLGYPDDLKGLILQLDTQQLALTDLQSLFITGKLSEPEIKAYLGGLGFSDSDVELLLHSYITHADTQASSLYRNAVRVAYEREQLTADQFMDMLVQIMANPQEPPELATSGKPHYDSSPEQVQQMATLEAAAIQFQRSFGRTQQTIATIKKLYESGHITIGETVKRLEAIGYSAADANELMKVWGLGPNVGKPGITSAKVLAYTKSGVFSPDAAYGKLLALGVNAKDAAFLAANPDPKAGPYYPPFSVATVLQAYMDQAATQQEAEAALERLGLNPAEITEELKIAHAKMNNPMALSLTPPGPFPAGTPKSLEEQERAAYRLGQQYMHAIETLFKAKAIGDQETINMLQELGMMQSDAGMLWAAWYTEVYGTPPGSPIGSV